MARWRRRAVGKQLYQAIKIPYRDRARKLEQLSKNWSFFGAPVGMILTIDRQMGPPQWCDLGLFLGNLMLLAREKGLHTCPQEAWSLWGKTIREVLEMPENELVFCGVAVGYGKADADINRLYTERAGLEEMADFRGF